MTARSGVSLGTSNGADAINEPTEEVALAIAADDYGQRGWRVIPIAPKGAVPKASGKFPAGFGAWQNKATTDPETIRRWWCEEYTGYGIGIATGSESGVFVVDVDVSNGKAGDDTLDALESEHGTLPLTYEVVTGSGGTHRYFRYPDGVAIRNDAGKRLGPGIDIRGEGGFVVAPPTIHPEAGERYEVEVLSADEPAEAPSWLIDLVRFEEPTTPAPSPATTSGDTVVDRWSARTDWSDLLEPRGWTLAGTIGEERQWTRPGKDARQGISATTHHGDADTLHVFTSSLPELEQERHYTKHGFVAAVLHGDDVNRATRWIAEQMGEAHEATDISELANLGAPVETPAPQGLLAGEWLFATFEEKPALWGHADEILLADGESLFIVSPTGVGKTTLATLLVRALCGLDDAVLGYPVRSVGRVLYLAMDRPAQIRRAMRRVFAEDEADVLNDRLVIRPGPVPHDLGKQPDTLVKLAHEAKADVVVLDSVKDACTRLSDDEAAGNFNRAVQHCLANGIAVIALHHQRKGTNGEKPNRLEDVYGNTWLTAGAGSVVLLWGETGGGVAELIHLKSPSTPVGISRIEINTSTGAMTADTGWDPLGYLLGRANGSTIAEAGQAMAGRSPSAADREKARRRLDALVSRGLATRYEGQRGGSGGSGGARYYAIDHAPELP